MYIYLSDRKRRFYLFQASPQNLSPKKNLSRKDRRFLEKNVANIQDSLSLRLVKQQKVLYSKHIGSLIEPQVFPRKAEEIGNKGLLSTNISTLPFALQSMQRQSNSYGGEIIPPLFLQVWEKQFSVYKTHALSLTSTATTHFCLPSDTFLQSKLSRSEKVKTVEPGQPGELSYQVSPLHKGKSCFAKETENVPFSFTAQKKPTHIYAFTALSVYVQAIKTYAEKCFTDIQNKSPLYIKNRTHNPIQRFRVALQLQNKKHNAYFAEKSEKEGVLKACLQMPFLAFSICKTLASPPLYANGKSLYLYSRYLYNLESLKTSITPQVLQNQKTASRYKYILHEKKKIALLYGQLAKKDMQTLIKSANALPGLFEDNMFTLLESRVDVLVHRAGFSTSIAGARQLIRNGLFYINGKKISSCKTRAFPGDFFALSSAGFNVFAKTAQAKPLLCKKQERPKKRELADQVLYNCYMRTTEQLYNLNMSIDTRASVHYKGVHTKKANQAVRIDTTKPAALFQSLLLYKDLCKKESLPWHCFTSLFSLQLLCKKRKNYKVDNKGFTNPQAMVFKGTEQIHKIFGFGKHAAAPKNFNTAKKGPWSNKLLNSCGAHILRYKAKQRQLFFATIDKEAIFCRFMKNIQNANSASMWGQKPLHLEISHKKGCFIYMYRPQKITFPVSLDLHAIKGSY